MTQKHMTRAKTMRDIGAEAASMLMFSKNESSVFSNPIADLSARDFTAQSPSFEKLAD